MAVAMAVAVGRGGEAVGPPDVASCLSICSHLGAPVAEVDDAWVRPRWNASGDWKCAAGRGAMALGDVLG